MISFGRCDVFEVASMPMPRSKSSQSPSRCYRCQKSKPRTFGTVPYRITIFDSSPFTCFSTCPRLPGRIISSLFTNLRACYKLTSTTRSLGPVCLCCCNSFILYAEYCIAGRLIPRCKGEYLGSLQVQRQLCSTEPQRHCVHVCRATAGIGTATLREMVGMLQSYNLVRT